MGGNGSSGGVRGVRAASLSFWAVFEGIEEAREAACGVKRALVSCLMDGDDKVQRGVGIAVNVVLDVDVGRQHRGC